MKKDKKSLSVSIDPDVNEELEQRAINKSKLVNKLLKEYLKNLDKEKIKTI